MSPEKQGLVHFAIGEKIFIFRRERIVGDIGEGISLEIAPEEENLLPKDMLQIKKDGGRVFIKIKGGYLTVLPEK